MPVLLLCYLAVASVMDIKSRKVKNIWILYGLLSGLLISFMDSGLTGQGICTLQMGSPGFVFSLLGIMIPLPMLFFFRWRLIGAGDIKLLMVIGCFLGVYGALEVYLISLFCAGAMAVISVILNIRKILGTPMVLRGLKIPLAPAMAMGVAIYAGRIGIAGGI